MLGQVYASHSESETRALGERFAQELRGGEVVLLCGDLGVGKTQFAKGVGRGLGVEAELASPTFILAARYDGRLPLVHYDLYRVRTARELREIGFLESDDAREVTLVEWGDRADPPPGAISVVLTMESDGTRRIDIGSIAGSTTP